jgi:hypothetical protein
MKSYRAWLLILALATLIVSGAVSAQAAGTCSLRCGCDVPCSTRCSEGPGLPILSCGEYTYEECIGKPICNVDSPRLTQKASSSSGFLLIFSSPAPAPTATPVSP